MSLVTGRGPLGPDRAGWFSPPVSGELVYVEPHPRRVQAFRGGVAVIDTERALLVHRAGEPLGYAFPAGEIDFGEPGTNVVDHVLSRFQADEQQDLATVLGAAATAVLSGATVVLSGFLDQMEQP